MNWTNYRWANGKTDRQQGEWHWKYCVKWEDTMQNTSHGGSVV